MTTSTNVVAVESNVSKIVKTFNKAFESAVLTIDFEDNFANGTGYYNGLTSAKLALEPGEFGAMHDQTTNRRVLVVGTSLGNVVIFERYTLGENDTFVVQLGYKAKALKASGLVEEGAVTPEAMEFLVGSLWDHNNIGNRVEMLRCAFAKI